MWWCFLLVLLAQLFDNSVGNNENYTIVNVPNFYDSTNITGLRDIETPRGEHLYPIYKKSFAYASIKDRLPMILQRMIDGMTRDQEEIVRKFGAGSLEELQQFINNVSELRRDLMTNQPLTPLPLAHSQFDCDIAIWNDKLKVQKEIEGGILTFFGSPFLLSECYMYRRMNQALAQTKTLSTYDLFEKQKQYSFTSASESLAILAKHTMGLLSRVGNLSKSEQKDELVKLLKLNLWSNRYDLSHSGGVAINSSGNPIELLDSFEADLLVDDTKLVWDVLNKPNVKSHPTIVDIILDNAGFELFTDLCLASFLVSHGFVQKVRFYVKRMPWLISDVNRHDFVWTVEYMRNSSDPDLKAFGEICARHLENNDWTIEIESFWTEPYDFGEMKEKSPALYGKLSEATLVVIKGDLNYRKLIGDINWDYTTTLNTVLTYQDFRPTSVAALRTLKCDICVGLKPGKAEELSESNKNWLISGKYGVINVCTDPNILSSDKQ